MKRAIALIMALGICVLGMSGCGAQLEKPALGLFSWKGDDARDPKELLKLCRDLGITEVYQSFSSDVSVQEAQSFLKEAKAGRVETYYLTGSPEWGLDPQAERVLEEVETAAALSRAGSNSFRGIVLDVEPYLTEEWDEDPDGTMEAYVSAMESVYESAQKEKLRLLLCIPYFYDTKGQDAALERLISTCCDGVAVMNYQKADEAGQLSREAELAERYGKQLIQIYELQEPGQHGLTSRNTYWEDGLGAVEQSRTGLLEKYPGLSFAYHDYRSLKELAGAGE